MKTDLDARPSADSRPFGTEGLGVEPQGTAPLASFDRTSPMFWWRMVAIVLLVTSAVGAAVAYWYAEQKNTENALARAFITEQQLRVQRVYGLSFAAAAGDPQAFQGLANERQEIDAKFQRWLTEEFSLPTPIVAQARALHDQWRTLREHVNAILAKEDVATSTELDEDAFIVLLEEANAVTTQLFSDQFAATGPPSRISPPSRILLLSELRVALEHGLGRVRTRQNQRSDATLSIVMGDRLTELAVMLDAVGRDALLDVPALSRLRETFATPEGKELLSSADASEALSDASRAAAESAEQLGGTLRRFSARHLTKGGGGTGWARMGRILGAVALVGALLFAIILIRDARYRVEAARLRDEENRVVNRRNQDAILKLLDEISVLGDGDLTTTASVTEEVTGAIADAFNYAIGDLRQLVYSINRTTDEVARSAQATRRRTLKLSAAATTQTRQIVGATAAAKKMADAGRRVSANAAKSREVAQRSVAMARRGVGAVRETIHGMDDIRLTIQDTAKRLKRLGESSQEIGYVVGLIDEVADQTNVLALNAAIQASMAGEAGRGFAVVADEVQRLAENARQATRRIEGLVITIQNDAKEAIASMEKSTTGVVSGTRLAEDAGVSLQEIENVSELLANLINAISTAAVNQAGYTAAIANVMNTIEQFATQAHTGTDVTARSAKNVVELAESLRASVARFRLPSTIDDNIVDLRTIELEQDGGTRHRRVQA